MANFATYTQIEDWEYAFKMNLAKFLKGLTGDGTDIFFLDKPWPQSTKPSIGIRIINYAGSGWGSSIGYDEHTDRQYVENNSLPTVELFAIRGNPLSLLEYVRQALYSYHDYKFEMFTMNSIGFLSSTNVTEANTVLDGVQTEYRARLLCNFSLCLRSYDLQETKTLQRINIHQKVREKYSDKYLEEIYSVYGMPGYTSINDLYDYIEVNGLPEGGNSTWINTWK